MSESVLFSVFLIFTGAAIIATLALYTRQSLLLAYIVLGILAGPSVTGLIDDPHLIEDIAHIGIIFLLFLLGLDLYPGKLLRLLKEATAVTAASTVLFALLGYAVAAGFGLPHSDCLLIGAATTLSSTIVSLKLLPTTILHHRHTGEVIISILLSQDLMAIAALLVIHGLSAGHTPWQDAGLLLLALPILLFGGLAVERWVLRAFFLRFAKIKEYVFLLVLGWCLGIAQLGHSFGLPYEIGAFMAGVTIANSPIAPYIADTLRPLRDFFLVMFFFALGAGFELTALSEVWIAALVLAAAVVTIKPLAYKFLFKAAGEPDLLALEAGVRLGQMSEFSLLLMAVALQTQLVSQNAAVLVQFATLITFAVSSMVVVLRYPTPIALSDRLRRD